MNQFPQYAPRPRPPVPLDHYLEPMPNTPPSRWRKYARKALLPVSVVAGTALLAGLMWSAADVLWSMGDKSPVSSSSPIAKPTAVPGPPVPKAVEQAPPVPVTADADGTYILGKNLQRGTYRATCDGALTFSCTYWVYVIVAGDAQPARQGVLRPGQVAVVELGSADFALGTAGFSKWVRS